MVLSITLILLLAALIMILWHAAKGTPPLWVPVLVMVIVMLLSVLPLKA